MGDFCLHLISSWGHKTSSSDSADMLDWQQKTSNLLRLFPTLFRNRINSNSNVTEKGQMDIPKTAHDETSACKDSPGHYRLHFMILH